MTDVRDLVRAAVVAPIGNRDHSSLSAAISMTQVVPNLCVSRIGFLAETSSQLEHSMWCNTGSALAYIWSADYPVEVLNEHLSLLV